jgi:hypothetical protein
MANLSYPKTNYERAKLYLHCMVEVKERLHVVTTILGLPLADLFKQELCYLQFRYICELIAIACLAAQGDYETQRSFTESYKPPEIFASLRELYPDFFPEPVERITTDQPGGQRRHHIERFHIKDAYGETDITSLWRSAGGHLHRASLKKYLRTTFSKPPKLDDVHRHVHGLLRLLGGHMIPIQKNPEEDIRIVVELGQYHEPSRIMFLHINHIDSTIQIEEYTSEIVRK